MPDEIPPRLGSVGKGIAIVLGFTVGALLLGLVMFLGSATAVGMVLVLGIGAVQAPWVVPVWSNYKKTGETETAKGILISAAIVFLLNAGCWGVVATMR